MDASPLITQSGAARALGVRPSQIQRWIEAGRLQVAYTADGLRLVTVASVEALRKERAR